MDVRKFGKELLEEKKIMFKEAAKNAAKDLGVRIPIINFWDCPDNTEGEIAHCHPDKEMICISETKLKQLKFEEIINTATHEVTHLRELSHNPTFHKIHQKVKATTWSPPSGGVVSFSEKDLEGPVSKPPKYKPNKKKCNYYHAEKHSKGKLKQCEYCKMYFCVKHIKPRPAGLTRFRDRIDLPEKLRKELHNPNSHPCIQYGEQFEKKEKEEKKRYGKALSKALKREKPFFNFRRNQLSNKSLSTKYVESLDDKFPYEESYETEEPPTKKVRNKKQKKQNWLLIISILLVVILGGVYLNAKFNFLEWDSTQEPTLQMEYGELYHKLNIGMSAGKFHDTIYLNLFTVKQGSDQTKNEFYLSRGTEEGSTELKVYFDSPAYSTDNYVWYYPTNAKLERVELYLNGELFSSKP